MVNIFKEIFQRRSLIGQLVSRELKVRYRRPALGFLWAFLTPFLTVAIFYVVFALFLKVQADEAPFILYLMTAVFPWSFFQESIMRSTTSLVDNRNLIKESAFPHYLIPLSSMLANGITFLPPLLLMIAVSGIMLGGFTPLILALPAILLVHSAMTLGLSIILSIVYVRWRDTRYVLDAVLLLLFYMTPVFYSISLPRTEFPSVFYQAYANNPLTGILNCYRAALLKNYYNDVLRQNVSLSSIIVPPCLFAVLILIVAFYYFNRKKNSINDYLYY